ncbi:MAG: hypothetical protein ACPG56_07600 [Flavobacteriales bacterium]
MTPPRSLHGLTMLFLLLAGSTWSCRPEDSSIRFRVACVEWADPSAPAPQVQVTLEEQRLENGVLNGFYTEVDQAVTGADGVVELATVRSNVLSIRLRVAREGCFEELVPFNPEDLTSGETLNHEEVAVMPQTRVEASLSNSLPECTNSNMIYRWIPRDVEGAASEVRWSCGTDWVAVEGGGTDQSTCFITGDTWLLHHRYWACAGLDSTAIDSVWCPAGEVVSLNL